jgi:hypothetical protein
MVAVELTESKGHGLKWDLRVMNGFFEREFEFTNLNPKNNKFKGFYWICFILTRGLTTNMDNPDVEQGEVEPGAHTLKSLIEKQKDLSLARLIVNKTAATAATLLLGLAHWFLLLILLLLLVLLLLFVFLTYFQLRLFFFGHWVLRIVRKGLVTKRGPRLRSFDDLLTVVGRDGAAGRQERRRKRRRQRESSWSTGDLS